MMNNIYFILFTGFQFFALVFLMCSLFKVDIKYHKKEILLLTLILTILSCTMIYLNLSDFILIQIPILMLLFKYIFQKKWFYSIIVGCATYTTLAVIEILTSSIGVYTHFITASELSDSFTVHSYIFQTLESLVAITIATYILLTSGGFGFSFRKRTEKVKYYVYATLISFVLIFITFYSFSITMNISILIILGILFLIVSLLLLVFSNKRDWIEFSDEERAVQT